MGRIEELKKKIQIGQAKTCVLNTGADRFKDGCDMIGVTGNVLGKGCLTNDVLVAKVSSKFQEIGDKGRLAVDIVR